MLEYVLFLCFFKLALAALSPPEDPYSGEADQNYLYEQACYQYAFEHSTRYESTSVQSKMLRTFYAECLTSVWPGCEMENTDGFMMAYPPYTSFKANVVITYDVNGKLTKIAHRPGFIVEWLPEPGKYWFIFWDPSKPKTDIERFNKIKFASINSLYDIHRKNLNSSIKKYKNAGIEESPDKLYTLEKLPNGKQHRRIDFKSFKVIVMSCIVSAGISTPPPKTPNNNFHNLHNLLMKHSPMGSIRTALLSKRHPNDCVRLLYPLNTMIKPGFPVTIHYMPSGMKHAFYPYHPKYRSFIAALFDGNGNFVKDPKNGFNSYMVVFLIASSWNKS